MRYFCVIGYIFQRECDLVPLNSHYIVLLGHLPVDRLHSLIDFTHDRVQYYYGCPVDQPRRDTPPVQYIVWTPKVDRAVQCSRNES